ncbi:MAG TPA: adenylate/guanylate cyclase domain-containing protein [Candidatus Acidoferrales bacterium]|nr:adenylate/guanylate cyclase domain-containing protein [Candidatus Acidoferrales bacterium]
MAHVLFMDIVGYSKLPMDHQEAVSHTLQAVVSATPDFLRAQAGQEMIRLPTGDGMALVFFGDAEAAARCALDVSRELKSHPEISLRMGLHSGPVYRVADINANQNVAGGGINIAQRVMDCGDAGHILASQSVADVLGQLSSWKDCLHDLGDAEVKHGVRVHLYNLYTVEAGNAALPQKLHAAQETAAAAHSKARRKKLARGIVAAAIIAALVAGGLWWLNGRKAHALTEKDTIVLADFTNTTGDAVFDGTLRQGLAIQLEQSPFLNILPDRKVGETLKLMGRSPGQHLDENTALDLCQRTESAAVLDGSIASLGNQYVLGLKALNCRTGDLLAQEQATADSKERVLKALGDAAAKLRSKLGESLSTVQKFDTPIEQATTPSLEALQAYTLGRETLVGKYDPASAVPFFQRAIRLDPNFAMAYASLGTDYFALGETSPAAENTLKAYDLRERVSEREKFYIESHYYHFVTGDLEKARQSYELWAQTYPRDVVPPNNLASIYGEFGQYDKCLTAIRESLRLDSANAESHASLVNAFLFLNRLTDARATAEEAQKNNFDSPFLHSYLYQVAFLQNDAAGMARQVAWSAGKPQVEAMLVYFESDTAAYSGRLAKARELSRRAVASAVRAEDQETAAAYESDAALREALFGNAAEARQRATASLTLSRGRDVQYGAALALAFAGDVARAKALADDFAKRFPEDTIVQFNYLPALHAQLALGRGDSSNAIDVLQVAAPYELGTTASLHPVYVRGEAYLAGHQGAEAAAEFQKVLDHRGIVLNEPMGALAHLGLARAYALEAQSLQGPDADAARAKARAAYNDFLTLWKDADPAIPILLAAKSEYAKLPTR